MRARQDADTEGGSVVHRHPFSPRTTQEPMAFTRDELGRGAWYAWIIFMILMLVGLNALVFVSIGPSAFAMPSFSGMLLTSLTMVTIYAGVAGGAVSLLVMSLGLPLARLLGRALRSVSSLGIHFAVYLAFGVCIGGATVAIASTLTGLPIAQNWFGAVLGVAAAVSVPAGWSLTVRRALREDRGLVRARRRRQRAMRRDGLPRGADADAAFEDSLLDPGREPNR
ncbi:MAG TPA: hypothetical protein VN241_08240 [Microbacterium sp.]|nr:hypothetical protein [Microbacterium sp.]